MSHPILSRFLPWRGRLAASRTGLGLALLLLVQTHAWPATPAIEIGVAPQAPAGSPPQQLNQLLRKHLPGQSAPTIQQAQQAFLEHLKGTSPIIYEEFLSGRAGVDDIASRLDIFLSEHPEYSGSPTPATNESPRQRVLDLLGAAPDLGGGAPGQGALADRFLGGLDATSLADLNAGRMTADELRSRMDVFIADRRADAARVATDPAIAAAGPIVEAFVKANYGSATDRANSVCYRGSAEENGATHDFVIFKKRPNLLRIHVMQGDLVVLVLGYDGTAAWAERIGHPAEGIAAGPAAELEQTAAFDDPLISYAERGAVVRLLEHSATGPIRLQILETDGTEAVVTIDPLTNHQTQLRRRRPGGPWTELHFSDFRRVGAITVAFAQELWADGKLKSTTRFTAVELDPGLLNHFFERPTSVAFDYMDFMNGLAVLQSRQKATASTTPTISLAR
jgi:hypothetical protein